LEGQDLAPTQERRDTVLLTPDLLPCRHRIPLVQHPRGKYELLVVGQRHVGVLGLGVGRVLRTAPAQTVLRGAFEKAVLEAAQSLAPGRQAARFHPGQIAGVPLAADGQRRVHPLDLRAVQLGYIP